MSVRSAASPDERRTYLVDLAVVTVLALAARLVAAAVVDYAPYTDPSYYTLVAKQLATGHGFTVPVIWSFLEVGSRLPDPAVLPVASNGHWMPLTSIIAAGSMWLFGPTWRAGQVPMVLLSALLVPFTYHVAWRFWHRRSVALVSAVLAIFAGPLLLYYPTIENFAVFGVAGAGALYASARAIQSGRPGPWLALAGAVAGVATLARVDGLLLTVAPTVAWLGIGGWRRWATVAWGFASAALFVAVLAPWMARNLGEYGALFPSAGGHTLWITSYNEQFSIGHPVDLAHYLAWGWGNIIGSKVDAWYEILGRTAVLLGGTFIFTFIPGMWMHRRRRELQPFVAYWLVMFAVMGLVFTFHAPKGAFYHSAPAWLPFAIPVAVASLSSVATAIGRFWPFLRRPQTHRFLLVVATLGAMTLSLIGSSVIYGQWDRSHKLDAAAARFFEENGLTRDVVMYSDPATLTLLSGNPGVAPPFDPYPVVEQVIAAYHVRWVVVQLAPGATTDALDFWAGAAGTDSEGNQATFLAAQPSFEVPGGIRIYAVVTP
jgi:4-amino-4-deoxy-L-arabinose transferase-like glycosyltransferase